MSTVSTQHPDYRDMLLEWQIVRALTLGTREVKRTGTVENILKNPDVGDVQRWLDYVKMAIYTNFTGRTKVGMVGAAFREEPIANMPAELEYLLDDCDGRGLNLNQLTKDVLGDLWSSGREIVVVDFPEMDEERELSAAESKELKALFYRYSALDLINWGDNFRVLREEYNASDDEFTYDPEYQYLVLRMSPEGCTKQVYRDDAPATEETLIKQANGEAFKVWPMVVIGSQNNDVDVDLIPLADIAHVNAGHFQNSADLEENCHVHGQLTVGISSDMDTADWQATNPNGVNMSARQGIFLGPNGSMTGLQAEANQLADKLMERKEGQIVQLGGRLIEKRTSGDTATAARIDATGENSVLADLVNNVEDGIAYCLMIAGMFMGVETAGDEYKLNRQFFEDGLDPQEAIAAMNFFDRGIITKPDIAHVARRSGFVHEDTTDEELMNGMNDPGLLPVAKKDKTVVE